MKTRRAKVVYSYVPQNDDELKLEVDDVIEILDEIEEGLQSFLLFIDNILIGVLFCLKGWWKGTTIKGITGVFPSNFVVEVTSDSPQINKKDLSDKSDNDSLDGSKSSIQRDDSLERKPKPIAKVGFGDIFAGGIKPKLSPIGDNKSVPKKPPPPTPALEAESAPKLPPKPVREQAKVLFGYEAQNEDELTIKEGDIITIVSKEIEDVGWWKGELNGRIALFPDNFVEMIKSDETNSTKAIKKPERPTEKPPPIANHSKASNLLKSDSMKSSNNKTFEELPKTSVVSNSSSSVSSAPVIPGKPVLNSSIFKSKPKQEPPTVPSSVKPDVVPHENGSKHDNKDIESNGKPNVVNNGSENHFTSMDGTSNKLTHLTQSRPKGPSSRRPPSTIFLPKDNGNDSKENGEIPVVPNRIEVSSSLPSNEQKPTVAEKSPPEKGAEKLPPWMVELRKAQEKRKENPEDLPKPSVHSPTKTSPNRFSGDFSNKSLQQSSTPDENDSNSVPPFKPPLKSTKPIITATPVVTEPVSTVSNVTTTANTTSKIVISSATTTTTKPTPKVEDIVTNSSADKKRRRLRVGERDSCSQGVDCQSEGLRFVSQTGIQFVLLLICFANLNRSSQLKRMSFMSFKNKKNPKN